VIFSSRSDEWATDPAVFARLDALYGPFTLDPCASDENAKCEHYYTRRDDGLAQIWRGRVWMNPPYGRPIGRWIAKAWEASQTTAEVVTCLLPSRTGARWWHDYVMRGEVEFLQGRLRFGGATNSAPFDSVVVVFRNGAVRDETPPEQLCREAGDAG
jgi:phage N-6-adenine-methyltransferase